MKGIEDAKTKLPELKTFSSKTNYTGYGLCYDEGGEFGHKVRQGNFDRTTNAKNVIIFLCRYNF